MYIPRRYEEKDAETVHAFIRENSFAILVSVLGGVPVGTHIPLLLEKDGQGRDILVGHISRGNEQKHTLVDGAKVLAIGSQYGSPYSFEVASKAAVANAEKAAAIKVYLATLNKAYVFTATHPDVWGAAWGAAFGAVFGGIHATSVRSAQTRQQYAAWRSTRSSEVTERLGYNINPCGGPKVANCAEISLKMDPAIRRYFAGEPQTGEVVGHVATRRADDTG